MDTRREDLRKGDILRVGSDPLIKLLTKPVQQEGLWIVRFIGVEERNGSYEEVRSAHSGTLTNPAYNVIGHV